MNHTSKSQQIAVKVLSSGHAEGFEDIVNTWLEKHEITILSIDFSAQMEKGVVYHSAYITYLKPVDDEPRRKLRRY